MPLQPHGSYTIWLVSLCPLSYTVAYILTINNASNSLLISRRLESRKVARKRRCTPPVGWYFGPMDQYRHTNVFVEMSLRCAMVPLFFATTAESQLSA